jgi:putative chitinase
MITAEQLLKVLPNLGQSARPYADALNSAMERFSIDTPKRVAHFLAQVAHESGDFTRFRENLNYSANALLKTWPPRFKNFVEAQYYERQPIKIANYVYANRMGNGDEKSGDGWKYRGTGWLQLTGADNIKAAGEHFDIKGDVAEWLSTVNGAALSAAWFWWRAGCNRYADMNNCDAVSDLINLGRRTEKVGDAIGFIKRQELTNRFLKVLA